MLIINFKNYPQALGAGGVMLAKNLARVAQSFPNVETALAISPVDIFRISEAVDIAVFSQHIDPKDLGQTTGFVIPEVVEESGASGTLVNHSEHPLGFLDICEVVRQCQGVGLKTVVCADSVEMIREIRRYLGGLRGRVDFIAYEPPELIGGEVSVVEAKPEIISEAAEKARSIPLLVGAGIHSKEDVETALKLGAVGVLVSSDIVLAEDPAQELRELLEGFRI